MLLGVKFTVNSDFKIKFYLFFYFHTVKCKLYTSVYTKKKRSEDRLLIISAQLPYYHGND
jgi:hypothetical protein